MRPLIVPFFIPHVGCPHTCSFCNQRLISGVTQDLPTAEQIVTTVQAWVARSPGRPVEVAFYGGSFTLVPPELQKNLLDAVQPLIEQGVVSSIRISTRPDALDDATLAHLAGYRVATIEVGVQSLDEQVLLQSRRGHTATESLAAIRRVKAAGFGVGAQLLPGLPGDCRIKSIATLQGVIDAGAEFVRIYPAVVLAGTHLAEELRSGRYCLADLEQGVDTCARMLHLCLKLGLPVIRIGLQAEEGLTAAGAILAGCWHPALGQLVKGRLYRDLVVALAATAGSDTEIQLFCHPSRRSEVQGHGRGNLQYWQQAGLPIQRVQESAGLGHDQVRLQTLKHEVTGSIITSCIYMEE